MDGFKFWIFSVCGATALTAVFKILLSNSSLKKVLNIFFSLFILFYTVLPMGQMLSKFDFNNKAAYENISSEEFYENAYKKLVEEAVKKSCEKLSVQVLSFNMSSYIDDDGYLNVKSLEIEIDAPERNEEIRAYLKKQLGFEVSVL